DSVGGGRNRARGVGPVSIDVHGRDLAWHRRTAEAIYAVRVVNVGGEVRMGVIQARIDVAHQHRASPARNGVSFRGLDLLHVPLECGQGVAVAGGLAATPSLIAAVVFGRG